MHDMRITLEKGESITVEIGNVRTLIWFENQNGFSISTATTNVDDVAIKINPSDGKVLKHYQRSAEV